MQCRCGNAIVNVPDHLSGVAEWICQQCTNTLPRPAQAVVEPVEQSIKRKGAVGRPKKAA